MLAGFTKFPGCQSDCMVHDATSIIKSMESLGARMPKKKGGPGLLL